MLVKYCPQLSAEDEIDLARKWHTNGDEKALTRLVECNVALVMHMAQDFVRETTPIEDLIQEGSIGLLVAAKKFDPDKGVRLATYASYWIRAYMTQFLLRSYGPVRFDTTKTRRRIFYNLNKARRSLEQQGAAVTNEALASELGVSKKDAEELIPYLIGTSVSLDDPHNLESPAFLGAMSESSDRLLRGAASPTPEAVAGASDWREHVFRSVEGIVSELSDRDRVVAENRILRDPPTTLKAVSALLGISIERVRQIEFRVKRRLRATLAARGIE